MLLFFETNTLCHNQLRALRTAALVYAFFEQSDRGLFVQLSFVKSTLRTNNQYMNIYTTYSNFFTIVSSKICPSPLKIRSSTSFPQPFGLFLTECLKNCKDSDKYFYCRDSYYIYIYRPSYYFDNSCSILYLQLVLVSSNNQSK